MQQYLGSVVPTGDNYFAALNSAVFSDGSFVFIPKGVRCPMELSTYFRINAINTGQFERTLIIAEDKSYVSYLEGCTAPMRDENQLHAAVVELVALEDAEIKYSHRAELVPRRRGRPRRHLQLRDQARRVPRRAFARSAGRRSRPVRRSPGNTRAACCCGDDSVGEFHSVALTHHRQQADTGTKMIHVGKRTKSKIVSKGISAGRGQNTYRGLVKVEKQRRGRAQPHPVRFAADRQEVRRAHLPVHRGQASRRAIVEHEATTSKICDDQLFYCRCRGIAEEDAVSMIVDGFCKQVFRELPMEFAVEAKKLLEVTLEGAVG